MKELKKKIEKASEFEKIDYSAFHEQSGSGPYQQYAQSVYGYADASSVDETDDILFQFYKFGIIAEEVDMYP